MRSYSSAVRPWLRARSSVTLGSAPVTPPPPRVTCRYRLRNEPSSTRLPRSEWKISRPSVPPTWLLGGALRVRHQPEHGAFLVDDARDVVQRPVGVGVLGDAPVLGAVAEDDLVLRAEPPQRLRVGVVLPLAVRDGHLEDLPGPHRARERGVRVLDAEMGRLAAVLEALVARQRAGQELAPRRGSGSRCRSPARGRRGRRTRAAPRPPASDRPPRPRADSRRRRSRRAGSGSRSRRGWRPGARRSAPAGGGLR